MGITLEQFRSNFRSFSNSMLSNADCNLVSSNEDRMMILVFGEMMDKVWRNDELMEMCYKEYLRNREYTQRYDF